jgi:hypothetical protein
MTIKSSTTARRRTRPIREHFYTVPVVRELPAPPPDALEAPSLW